MLMPKRTKYRKTQKGRMTGQAKGGTKVAFGEYGLQATDRLPKTRPSTSRP